MSHYIKFLQLFVVSDRLLRYQFDLRMLSQTGTERWTLVRTVLGRMLLN